MNYEKQVREKRNEMFPEYLELCFGCEVKNPKNGNISKCIRYIDSNKHIEIPELAYTLAPDEYVSIGPPVTILDALRVFVTKRNGSNRWNLGDLEEFFMEIDIDPSKPLYRDQTEEVQKQLAELIL